MTSPAAPILTLTGNLLAERTLEFDHWAAGRTQRARRELFQVGGKGINVSKMLTRLGAPTLALGFAGGAPGAECEAWLRAQRIPHRIFRTTTATRVGTVVRTLPEPASPQPETTFLGPDAVPDGAALQACADFLEEQPSGGVLAICGSLPGWSGPDFDPLRAALRRWQSRGILAVDCYGPALAWLADLPPDLVKINSTELCSLVPAGDRPPSSATRWVVTDGPGPVRIWDEAGQRELLPPRVREVSPTGSGDVFFACLLHAVYGQGRLLLDAVSFALPYAAANAAHPGIAEFPEASAGA